AGPVRGVLRPGACIDGVRGDCAGAGGIRRLAARQRDRRYRGRPAVSAAIEDQDRHAQRLEVLRRIWSTGPGLRGQLTAVNHGTIGLRFIVTGFAFMLVGGLLSMFIRLQLAWFDADVLDPERYNQFVTLHGTTMMFLFAVP